MTLINPNVSNIYLSLLKHDISKTWRKSLKKGKTEANKSKDRQHKAKGKKKKTKQWYTKRSQKFNIEHVEFKLWFKQRKLNIENENLFCTRAQ